MLLEHALQHVDVRSLGHVFEHIARDQRDPVRQVQRLEQPFRIVQHGRRVEDDSLRRRVAIEHVGEPGAVAAAETGDRGAFAEITDRIRDGARIGQFLLRQIAEEEPTLVRIAAAPIGNVLVQGEGKGGLSRAQGIAQRHPGHPILADGHERLLAEIGGVAVGERLAGGRQRETPILPLLAKPHRGETAQEAAQGACLQPRLPGQRLRRAGFGFQQVGKSGGDRREEQGGLMVGGDLLFQMRLDLALLALIHVLPPSCAASLHVVLRPANPARGAFFT